MVNRNKVAGHRFFRPAAMAALLLGLGGCAGSDVRDVSLREVSYAVATRTAVFEEMLDAVVFEVGCPQKRRPWNLLAGGVGYRGLVLPAGCSFRFPIPAAAQLRVETRLNLHPRDLELAQAGEVGLPAVTFAVRRAGPEQELFRLDFSDPATRGEAGWRRRSVQIEGGSEIELVVRIEPQAGKRRQARVFLADLQLERIERASLSLEREARWVAVPRAFRKKVPAGEDAGELFRTWARHRRFFHRALSGPPEPPIRQALASVVAAQEESFKRFTRRWSAALFWELWEEIPEAIAPHPAPHPDVVLIVIDAARQDHFSAYGYHRETTPSIDALVAREGFLFADAYSTGTGTNVSMPTMMTSHYPSHHYFSHRGMSLPEYETTLAQVLSANHYVTLGVTTNPYLGVGSGMERGYLVYDAMERYYYPYPKAEDVFHRAREFLPYFRWLPTFLYLHLMDAHGPYRPPPPFDRLFDGVPYSDQDQERNRAIMPPYGDKELFQLPLAERRRRADISRLINLYDGELRYADHQIGRYLEELKELGVGDSAVIVVTADHGEELLDHGFTYHSSIPHEEKIRIPLIIKPPLGSPGGGQMGGSPGGGQMGGHSGARRIAGRIDGVLSLFPTILDLVGLPLPEGLHGSSLMPRVRGRVEGDAVLFHDNEWFHTVRRGPWKLFTTTLREEHEVRHPERAIIGAYDDMLFNLESDPGERTNLIAREPRVARELRQLIAEKFGTIARQRERALSDLEKRELDRETKQRLEALGYVE